MLAIAGGKGGTGKTTMALALARELAAATAGVRRTATRREGPPRSPDDAGPESREVLVVDADVEMPDLHAMAGVEREPTVLANEGGQRMPESPGVRVAPAPPPDATAAFGVRLRELSGNDGRHARCVLVDAPCGAGPDAALALDAASGVVLVTRPTPAAVRDTAKTAAMARAVGTPLVAAVVVGSTPSRPLGRALGVEDVVTVPYVDGDPLSSEAHASATRQLVEGVSTRQTPF